MSISTPKLILVDPNRELCECWKKQFRGLSHVEIVNGRFEKLEEFDCMVSAADSFGLMDGGVDLAISSYFGFELMDRVQERIIRDYLGEQPVGTSIIVETGNTEHPFIAHTPTMRVPMTIATTDYVFAAMWAMLVAVHQHNREALCPKCYEERYSRIDQHKTWREKIASRLTVVNGVHFLGAFAISFVSFRTAFFHIYTYPLAPKPAAVSALLAALFVVVTRKQ
jgi:hypothetical protein